MPKIFISATSRDLKSYRGVVAEWAKARGDEVVVQDDFDIQPDYVTIAGMLRDKLAPCDAAVCLVGDHYGFEPVGFPPGEARRSFTQLEYELAKTLRRPVYLFFTAPATKLDAPPGQSDEHAALQQAHRARLQQRNNIWYPFDSAEQLRRQLDTLRVIATVGRPENLPFASLGTLFKGRDGFLDQLRQTLVSKPSHAAAVTGKQTIHGLGGVGKTRAAVEYGWKYAEEYTALLFVTADSPENLARNLAALSGAMVLNLPEQDAKEQEVQLRAVTRWLRENAGWFLIVDNVDTPAAAEAVEKQLLALSAGHVVITSRLSDWQTGVEPLELDVLAEQPAADFLLEKTAGKRRPTAADPQDAQALAHDLGGLALALEQAGAFIAKHRGSFAEYRQRWQRHDTKVLEWFDQRAMKYPKSVATTWQTSVDKLSADGRNLLKVLCWLAPDPIPADMVRKLTQPEGSRPPLLRRLLDRLTLRKRPAEIDVEKALADLATYSLVKWDGAAQSVTVHRLVEEITRYRLAAKERLRRLEQCLWMVEGFLVGDPQDVRTWPGMYAPARNHIEAVTREADRLGAPDPTAGLMCKLAIYLLGRGSFAEAEPLFRRALAVDEADNGPDHPLVASHLSNLAILLRDTNRPAEAEPLIRRALAIQEAAFGTNHPNVAFPLSNLGGLLRDANRPAEAEPLFRRSLAIGEASHGPDHHIVAVRLGNLAQLYHDTNRFAEAEPLMRRALAIDEANFGPDHPSVAGQLSNLGVLLQVTGRSAEAEPLYRRALAIDEASFGPDHPSVAVRINNLAHLLKHTNRLAEAEPLFRLALEINEASYGPGHPHFANSLNNLAGLLEDTGRPAEAEAMYRRAVAILRDSLGDGHPETKLVRRNYDLLLQARGQSRGISPQLKDLP